MITSYPSKINFVVDPRIEVKAAHRRREQGPVPGNQRPDHRRSRPGHISALLCELGDRDLSPVVLRDAEQRVRVVLQRPGLGELVDIALTQPRRYGAADPAVMGRMLDVLAELAWRFPPEQHHLVRSQLARFLNTIAAQDFDTTEIAQLRTKSVRVQQRLTDPPIQKGQPS